MPAIQKSKMNFMEVCRTILIAFSVLRVGSIVIVYGEPQILDLQLNNRMVNEGQSIEAKCSVRDVTSQHKIIWYKQGLTAGSADQLQMYKIAEDDRPEYPQLDYSFWINKNGVVFDYMMRVQSVQVTMSGNYSCAVVVNNLTVSNKTVELYIIVEPRVVEIYVDGVRIEQNSTQLYRYSSLHNLQCIASQSSPAATLNIWHGTQDLTSQATSLTISKPLYSPPPDPLYPFLSPITRSSNLTLASWRIDVTYVTAQLTCLARASDRSPGRTVKFTPIIEDGPPHFVCNDTLVLRETDADDENHVMTCIVLSKPALTGATFGCEPSNMCRPFTAFPPHEWHPASDTVYSGILSNADPRSTDLKEILQGNMTLRVRMRRENLIGRSFVFSAENTRGQALHHITAISGAGCVLSSVTLCIVTFVLSLMQ